MACENNDCSCQTKDDTNVDPALKEAKTRAETRKLEIEIEEAQERVKKQRLDATKLKNEEERAKAKHEREIRALDIAVQKGTLALETDRIIRDRNQREEEMILACDWNHHVYNFSDEVNQDSVLMCMQQLNQWVRRNAASGTSQPLNIEIVFDSPGGNVFDGMHLFDYIRWVRSQGHNITTVALGNAASMAGILIQAGTTRVIGEESYLLIHKISQMRFMDHADADQLMDRMEHLKKLASRVNNIFARRAANVLVSRGNEERDAATIEADTLALIDTHTNKKDWWIDSDEALKYGFVDEIR